MFQSIDDPSSTWKLQQNQLIELLSTIQKEETNFLDQAFRSKLACKDSLRRLQETDLHLALPADQEAYYFKIHKPFFWGYYIYFNRIYDLEVGKPPLTTEDQANYYRKHLKTIDDFFQENKFIYRYIRSGSTHLDDKLFFDPSKTGTIALNAIDLQLDFDIPVCYDYVAAQIKANELLSKYITTVLEDLLKPGQLGTDAIPTLNWTESKTGLIELSYALQSAGVFNNGKVELKEIIDFLQMAFHINLGHYPRTFQEILSRKTGYTNFIDKLRDKLLLRIQNIEEKYDR